MDDGKSTTHQTKIIGFIKGKLINLKNKFNLYVTWYCTNIKETNSILRGNHFESIQGVYYNKVAIIW